MTKKIKISVVSYVNSLPFVHGLEHSEFADEYELQKDIPSECARKLVENEVDIGLIPVAVIPLLREAYILTSYCIGAVGEVSSVLLLSEVPLEKIETILLDFHSRSSVQLTKILAEKYWKISPQWKNADDNFLHEISGTTAAVVIGDRTFNLKKKFAFAYDLSLEWQKMCGLPFVFACWVANKKLPEIFLQHFSQAIEWGVKNKSAVIDELKSKHIPDFDAEKYLNHFISFDFDDAKKKGMNLFLKYLKEAEKSTISE